MSQQKSNRRDFLKTTAGMAAGGATAPYFFTSAQAQEASAIDRLTVAAIGCGGRGSGIGHQAGGRGNMVACCDVDADRAADFAKRYENRCQTYGDYREVLKRQDVEAVTIGTPDHWHVKIAIEAMQAGKDVYCEKPLTLTIGESKLICQVTKATGRVFQVGTQQRSEYGNMFLKAVAMARSGRLGKKLHAAASVGEAESGGPFPTAD
ncbi:MAG: Gfo/Idh/MocA family oxidoreductase, partial [Planctomycetota bacterium]